MVRRSIEAVGAQDLAHRNVSELSDGERQKGMLARALAQEPSLMILDEITAFLDLPRRVDIMRTSGCLRIHAELLTGKAVFWGVAPVTTDKSRAYWEVTNRAIFPREFAPTLEWNQAFARRVLGFLQNNGGHIYFMPIRIDIERYLHGVL